MVASDGLHAARMVVLSGRDLTTDDAAMAALTGPDMWAIVEYENTLCLAACTLDEHPGGTNWVQENGGLPQKICEVARAILRGGGGDVSRAIAIAVGRMKVWATGTGVSLKVQAEASAAVAEWEKLKVSAHAKSAAKAVAHAGKGNKGKDDGGG